MRKPPGLFITGNDTNVGKTYVGALIAAELAAAGYRVGVYKPAASGCRVVDGQLVAEDALQLWRAAGEPETLQQVCPQMFAAPLAPHLAAHAEGKTVDPELLRAGARWWYDRCDFLLVEGAGGLMSPISDEDYVADLAEDLGFPLVVVSRNTLGTINLTLQTLITAASYGNDGLETAGIVLVEASATPEADPSTASNPGELEARCVPPLLARVGWHKGFDRRVDWLGLANAAAEAAEDEEE